MSETHGTNDTSEATQTTQTEAGAQDSRGTLLGADPAPQDTPAAPQEARPQESARPAAPQDYTFTTPEDVPVDAAVLDAFSDVAKGLNLPQDAAQTVLDKMAPVLAQRQAEQITAARNQWEFDARADAEFGGDKLDENLAVAKRAMDAFATPALKTLLNESGLGSHPEIIRAFYRAGRAISQDSLIAGSSQPASRPNTAQRLYGASNMNP